MRIGDTTVPRWVPMSWRRALWRFIEKGWIDPTGIGQVNAARSALKLPSVQTSFLAHIENEPDPYRYPLSLMVRAHHAGLASAVANS
jgi:rhamnosyltransferase subunit B